MLVTLAITPPDHVLDDVEAALARTPVPPGEFDLVPRASLMIPVFSLGNITKVEATKLASFLRDEVDDTEPPPRVRFSGVWALEDEGDPTVGLPLIGEVERVNDLARSLPSLVAQHGYFVDRRRYVPRLTIGSVTPTTSLAFLERLVGDLEGHASPVWPVTSVTLLRPRFDDDRESDVWEIVEQVPTGTEPASPL